MMCPVRKRPLAILVVLLLAAVGCTSGAQGDAQRDGKRGGTLIRVINGDPSTLNPALMTGPALQVACKIFDGLVRLDRQFNVKPSLAESWDVTDDGLKYTFHLRKGVTWHDGKPFTSADVKWTFEDVTSKYGARANEAFKRVKRISAPDDHTVVLDLKEPYGVLLTLLTCNSAAVMPKHVYDDGRSILNHPRNTDDPIGTGPFKFESWEHGQAITLVRNDKYWRANEGMPYLDRLVERIITDQDAITSALMSGEVDVVNDPALDPAAYKRLVDHPDLEGKDESDVPGDSIFILNTQRKPFSDVKVRQALFHAIDRDLIIKNVMFGRGEPGRSAIDSRLSWAHNSEIDYNTMYAYDPAKAKQILDDAGYPAGGDGTRFGFTMTFNATHPNFNGIAQIIRENLKKVGIAVKLQPLELSIVEERVFTKRDFETAIHSTTTAGDPAIGVEPIYVKNGIRNASGYSNPEVDRLFAAGAAARTHEERAQPYKELQEVIANDVPVIVLAENPSADVVSSKVKGMWRGPDYFDWWEEVYLEE